MSRIKIDDTLRMYYETDSFVEPWVKPETILLVHGLCESSAVWYAWIPPLSHKYATVRIDLRGFGKSSVPPEGYQWSLANFARDIKIFMDKIDLHKVHLVGAKIAGRISLQFAHDYPDRLHSLTVVGAPRELGGRDPKDIENSLRAMEREGAAHHSRATMKDRLGDVPEEMFEWWIKLFDSTSPRVAQEVLTYASPIDVSGLLPDIKVPTLAIVRDEGPASKGAETIRELQRLMPHCEFALIPSTGYHIAATKPEECVAALLRFLERLHKERQ